MRRLWTSLPVLSVLGLAADAGGAHTPRLGGDDVSASFGPSLPRPARDRAGRLAASVRDLDVRWDATHTTVRARDGELRLSLDGVSRRGAHASRPIAGAARVTGCVSEMDADPEEPCLFRVERSIPALAAIEWWVGQRRGVEQGWTIAGRPAGDGPLTLALSLGDDVARVEPVPGGALRFVLRSGRALLYGDARARDARGAPLPVSLAWDGDRVRVTVDDDGARYPIVIDPLLATAGPRPVRRKTPQAGSAFGRAVGGGGDVNGDGYDDIVVGAPLFDKTATDEGRAFLYAGGPFGLSAAPLWGQSPGIAGAELGASVAVVGDVNGDGYADIMVGAPAVSNGHAGEGRVYLFRGGPGGPEPIATAWTWEPDVAGARAGATVAPAGDLNKDGFADVLVGAPQYTNGEAGEGAVFVFFGSATGLEAAPKFTLEGGAAGAELGAALAAAGDVDKDGFGDILVGAPGHGGVGRAILYKGSAGGFTPLWTLDGTTAGERLGASVTAGDFNGDGRVDVVTGAPLAAPAGRVDVFLGAAAGLPLSTSKAFAFATQDPGGGGTGLATAGDMNGDGLDDLAIAFAPSFPSAWFVLGATSGITPHQALKSRRQPNPALPGARGNIVYPWPDIEFAGSVAAAGDLDGDGFANVVRGELEGLCVDACWDYDGDGYEDAEELMTTPALNPYAWDTDGDGCSDFIEGTWYQTAPARVASLLPADTSACDFDGDGLSNALEAQLGTNPRNADSDGDLIDDFTETRGGHVVDTDGDGTPDALDLDSDGDGRSDALEGRADPDRDRIPAYRDTDDDNDGIPSVIEYADAGADGGPSADGGAAADGGGELDAGGDASAIAPPVPPPEAGDCSVSRAGGAGAGAAGMWPVAVAAALALARRRRARRR